MPSWYLKAMMQGAISKLPSSQSWNRVFQKHVTKTLVLTEPYFLEKWQQCKRHIDNLSTHAEGEIDAKHVLEIGTGWFPINPIGLALSGLSSVTTVDLQGLLKKESVRATLKMFLDLIDRRVIDLPFDNDSYNRLQESVRLPLGAPPGHLLDIIGVKAHVADITAAPFKEKTFDLICSNNTLEHVPRRSICEIFKRVRVLATEGGIMSHFVDLADHYANFDKSITPYNFLRFSSERWELFNNNMQWQNRLRITDYRAIHQESGWSIIDEESNRLPLEILRTVSVAQEFRRYSEDDLRVVGSWIVSR